jgi:hypothetical protein
MGEAQDKGLSCWRVFNYGVPKTGKEMMRVSWIRALGRYE